MLKLKHVKISLAATLIACFFSAEIFAAPPKNIVKKIQFSGKNRFEIYTTSQSEFKIFTLENPPRLVVDIANAQLEKADYKPALPFFATSFRNKTSDTSLRLVFDLSQKISLQNTRFEKNTNKIITEIDGIKKEEDFISNKVEEFEVQTTRVLNPDGSAKYVVRKTPIAKSPKTSTTSITQKDLPIIVIDSGHGGKDPGTIGNYARTKEKNVTLSYAKELGKQLANTGRYKVYLTRDNDFFIPLKIRVEKARRKKADLFISLHANSISDGEVSGFSIYTLSEKSSDKQAELLAQKENRVDIINGVNFSGASQDIMKTLIDLSQRETKNSSARFANIAIKSVKKSGIEILQNTHRFAGFAVLTAPDMSSVLIELGYLSNKDEEALLNSLVYKRKVATSLVEAINEYFEKNKN